MMSVKEKVLKYRTAGTRFELSMIQQKGKEAQKGQMPEQTQEDRQRSSKQHVWRRKQLNKPVVGHTAGLLETAVE